MGTVDVDEVELRRLQRPEHYLRAADQLHHPITRPGGGDVVIEVALEVTEKRAVHRNGERIDAGEPAGRVSEDVVEEPARRLPFETADLQAVNVGLPRRCAEVFLPG